MEWGPFRGEKGLIGTDSLILKRASHHFMACLVMCLSGEKNLNNVSFTFTGRLYYITLSAGFPGLSCSARTFWIYVHLIVNTGVCNSIQVSAHAIHSPLCTPAHPLGLPAQRPGTWP